MNDTSSPTPQRVRSYLERAFAALQSDPHAEMPEPDEDLLAGAKGRIFTGHSIGESGDVEPLKRICPPGTTGECWLEQRKSNGRVHWAWVCDCVPV